MTNKWLEHVKKVKKENPKLLLKEVLKLAKKSYRKTKLKKKMSYTKGYRMVTCKNCGHRQRFETYHDEWGTDDICDYCGQYLEEYK